MCVRMLHAADEPVGKRQPLARWFSSPSIAVIIATELRLPDHPEARVDRLASIDAWTIGASNLYISVPKEEVALAHLLSRVTWVDGADTPPDMPAGGSAQFWRLLRCWRLVHQDEERRLQRQHDWYFRPRPDFALPLPTVQKLVEALQPVRDAIAAMGRSALFMESDRFFGGGHAAFTVASTYFAKKSVYPGRYCQWLHINYTLVALSEPPAARFEWLPVPRAPLGDPKPWAMWSQHGGGRKVHQLVSTHLPQLEEYSRQHAHDPRQVDPRELLCVAPTPRLFGSEVGFLTHALHNGLVVKKVPQLPHGGSRLSRGPAPARVEGTRLVAGTCGITQASTKWEVQRPCADHSRSNGSWPLQKSVIGTWAKAFVACRALCQACSRCRWFSFSPDWSDCSWYSECGQLLHMKPDFASAQRGCAGTCNLSRGTRAVHREVGR